MRKTFLGLFWLMSLAALAGHYEVSSPNGKVKVTVDADEIVKWAVDYDGRQVLLPSAIDISLTQGKKTLGLGKVGKVAKLRINESFQNPFYKKLTVSDDYGQLLLYTNQKFTIEVRAYDDGAASPSMPMPSMPSREVRRRHYLYLLHGWRQRSEGCQPAGAVHPRRASAVQSRLV